MNTPDEWRPIPGFDDYELHSSTLQIRRLVVKYLKPVRGVVALRAGDQKLNRSVQGLHVLTYPEQYPAHLRERQRAKAGLPATDQQVAEAPKREPARPASAAPQSSEPSMFTRLGMQKYVEKFKREPTEGAE